MKILFFEIFTTLGEIAGGDAKQVCYLSEEFKKRGEQVEILNLHFKDKLFIRDIKFMARFLTLSQRDIQTDVIFASGTPFWALPTYFLKKKMKSPAVLYITHCNNLRAKIVETVGLSGIAWREGGHRLFFKSIINNFIFIFLVFPDLFKTPALFRFSLRGLDKIIVSCEYIKRQICHLVDKDKVTVIYPLIENKVKYDDVSEPSSFFTIFYFGAFYSGRGVIDLIYAFLKLKDKFSELRLVIAGYPKYEETSEMIVRSMVDKYDLKTRIDIHGYRMDVMEELKKASVVSIPFHDGVLFQPPLTLLEAMRMGKCVISTDCGAVAEFIADGQTGFLVQKKDINMLAGKIEYLIKNPEIVKIVGGNAKAAIEKKCNFQANSQKIKEILEEVLPK